VEFFQYNYKNQILNPREIFEEPQGTHGNSQYMPHGSIYFFSEFNIYVHNYVEVLGVVKFFKYKNFRKREAQLEISKMK